MAQDTHPDSQDFASLTTAIIPSNIYFNSWNQTSAGGLPNAAGGTMKSDLTSSVPQFGDRLPSSDLPKIPMRFSDAGVSNSPAFSANSPPHFLASHNQDGGSYENQSSREQQSPSTAPRILAMNSQDKFESMGAKDPISALKLKAKESVLAKRARSIRSASRDSKTNLIGVSGTDLTREREDTQEIQAGQPELSNAATATANEQFMQSSHQQNGSAAGSTQEIPVELEDLLAEGRAAASMADVGAALVKTTQVENPSSVAGQQAKGRGGTATKECPSAEPSAKKEGHRERQMASSLLTFPTSEIDEIDMWLTMTGYYDKPYREKVLGRRRRFKEIEEEKLRLLEEEQADQRLWAPLHHSTETLAYQQLNLPGSIIHPSAPTSKQHVGIQMNDSVFKSRMVPDAILDKAETPKKRRMEENVADDEAQYTKKSARTNSYQRTPPDSQRRTSEGYRQSSVGKKNTVDPSTAAPQQQFPQHRTTYDRHARESGADHYDSQHRSRERVRPRSESRGYIPQRHDVAFKFSPVQKAASRSRKVRFFLVKSWNYDNIMIAQEDNTWATQTKNEEIFVEAFETCRHVIFIFSANHSKAFQGYARMQGLPGERGVKQPSWVKKLHWQTTEPFRIKWIVKAETPYRSVGSLKNPLNDDLPIFVGRDGQEIPEEMGDELCGIIDQDSGSRAQFRH